MLKEEPDQLAQILRKLSSYMDNRKSLKSDFYSPVNNESSINYSEDYLQIYWENMLKASDSEWQSGVIVSLKKDFVEKFGNSKTHFLDPIFFETSLFVFYKNDYFF
ncbi:hypothetical protein MHBO_001571 [Bonamia ostreae]|uniref:Uncharacterized protein n=1 Tax=Bonamia ostreae TaxID=126728 RepID=A0ABV2AJE4_9EUKA